MLKNLGCPTLFMTLSANDYHWKELAKTLKVPLENLPKAVQQNPLITAIHFERRWKALLNHVLLSGEQPLGELLIILHVLNFSLEEVHTWTYSFG